MSSGDSCSSNDRKITTLPSQVPQQQLNSEESSPLLRLPTELRQQILTHLLWTQLYSMLTIWVTSANDEPPRQPRAVTDTDVAVRAARAAALHRPYQVRVQTHPLLHTLHALGLSCTTLRSDLVATLNPVTADLLNRWGVALRQGHIRLYRHMRNLIADGMFDDVTQIQRPGNDEREDGPPLIRPIRTMEAALRSRVVGADAVFQQIASRLLYEEPSGALYDARDVESIGARAGGMLGMLAEEMQALMRTEWMLKVSEWSVRLEQLIDEQLRANLPTTSSTGMIASSFVAGLCVRFIASSNAAESWTNWMLKSQNKIIQDEYKGMMQWKRWNPEMGLTDREKATKERDDG